MKAIWGMEYDMHTDSIYHSPSCPKCEAPIFKEHERYLCISCGEEVEVDDPEMQEWLRVREETREITQDCMFGCGGKDTVHIQQTRNPITLKWQTMYGECEKCGMSFIV